MANKGKVLRVPNQKVLEQLGISRATSSALTRKAADPIEIHDEVILHPAVAKMENSYYQTRIISEKKTDKRLEKSLEQLGNLGISSNSKLDELKKSKDKYQSDRKMDHEVELETKRKENRRLKRTSLSEVDKLAEARKAEKMYSSDIKSVSVQTDKAPSKKKTEKIIDSGIKMSDEIKKLRVSITGSNVKEEKVLKNAKFTSPSSQFFASQLGWLGENDSAKRIVPSELEESQMPVENNEVVENQIDNQNENDEVEEMTFREMDFAEIQRLERKYKKEADDIRRQLEKQNRQQDRTLDNISTVYDKLLGNSPAVKVAQTKPKDLGDVANISKDVDVSKIPSFVLEEQKRKESTKK